MALSQDLRPRLPTGLVRLQARFVHYSADPPCVSRSPAGLVPVEARFVHYSAEPPCISRCPPAPARHAPWLLT